MPASNATAELGNGKASPNASAAAAGYLTIHRIGPEGQSKNRNANLRGRDRIFNEERQKAWEKEPKVSKVPKKGYYKVEGIDSMEYHREEKPHAEYSHK